MTDDADMRPSLIRTVAALAAVALLGGARDLQTLTLADLLARSDGGVAGRIESRSVRAVDVGDGAPMYFTTIHVVGTDLATGKDARVDVVFAGGFVDETHGTFNASAPAAHETRVGRGVIAFHRRSNDIAGGFAGDVLVGARAGLFTTFDSRRGATIVQGRGRGHAIVKNVTLERLRATVSETLERSKRPR